MRSITSNSYIIVNHKKIYLNEEYFTLKRKIEEPDNNIQLHKSGLITDTLITLDKSTITMFGKV